MIERVLLGATVMGVVSLGAFWWMIKNGWPVEDARNALLLLIVLFENVQIGNCRSETRSGLVLSPFSNPLLLAAALGSLAIHAAAMHWPPLARLLKTGPLSIDTLAALAALSLTVFFSMEIYKLFVRLRRATSSGRP